MKQTLQETLHYVHLTTDGERHTHPSEIDDTLYKVQAKSTEEAASMIARSTDNRRHS